MRESKTRKIEVLNLALDKLHFYHEWNKRTGKRIYPLGLCRILGSGIYQHGDELANIKLLQKLMTKELNKQKFLYTYDERHLPNKANCGFIWKPYDFESRAAWIKSEIAKLKS